MRILADDVDVSRSSHAGKRVLLDTVILCHAHDRLSPHYTKASLIVKASIGGLIEAYISYQNFAEFYSVMTGKRVKKPLAPAEAAELCMLYEKSVAIRKLLPPLTRTLGLLSQPKNCPSVMATYSIAYSPIR